MKTNFFICLLLILAPYYAKAQDLAAAEQEFAAGNYKKVQQILSPYIESLDRRPLILLAQSYSKLKNHLSATKVYRAALSKNPADLEAKSLLAVELLNMNQEMEAKQVLKEIIESNPTFVPAYTKLADIYEKSNNNYELRLLYQDLVSKIGEKSKYISKLCSLTTNDGLYDLSKSYCEKGIKLNPKEPLNHLNLAQTLLQTDKKAEGLQLMQKISKQFLTSFEVQFHFAKYLMEEKNFILANKHFGYATRIRRASYEAWLGLAFSSLEIQKYDLAVQAFKNACDANKLALTDLRKGISLLRTSQANVQAQKLDQISETCGKTTPKQ